jgi:hypothetical protein
LWFGQDWSLDIVSCGVPNAGMESFGDWTTVNCSTTNTSEESGVNVCRIVGSSFLALTAVDMGAGV